MEAKEAVLCSVSEGRTLAGKCAEAKHWRCPLSTLQLASSLRERFYGIKTSPHDDAVELKLDGWFGVQEHGHGGAG